MANFLRVRAPLFISIPHGEARVERVYAVRTMQLENIRGCSTAKRHLYHYAI